MHVVVYYGYAGDPDNLVPMVNNDVPLRNLFGGEVISYKSGLSVFLCMIIFLNPKRVFIGDSYHGIHGVLDVMEKLNGMKKLTLKDLDQLQADDVVHVETPLNPTGEARNLEYNVGSKEPIRPSSTSPVAKSGAAAVTLSVLFQAKEEYRGNSSIKTHESPLTPETRAAIMM
ncbi:hypothetical protein DER44DRAFT_857719 [Fusarium oxysporum]|nr:hypothetical protein DER44DRAFT_857719 [Fusarium oxysporum]